MDLPFIRGPLVNIPFLRGWLGYLSYANLQKELLRRNNHSPIFVMSTFGITMQYDLRCMTDIAALHEIFHSGAYERAISSLVVKELKAGDVFIDVGANSGYYTLLASKAVGQEGRVYAVEPSLSRNRLLSNMAFNSLQNITVIPEALWREQTTRQLYLSDFQDGYDSMVPIRHRGVIAVQTTTLDSVVGDSEIALVKIDAQGAEGDILRGAASSVKNRRIRKIILEWYEPLMGDKEGCFELYRTIGAIFKLENNNRLTPISRRSQIPSSCNLLLVPK